jgi:hypothetical protein
MTSLARTVLMEMDSLIIQIQTKMVGIQYEEAKQMATAQLKQKYGESPVAEAI